jgi:dTDP-4-dehydrorhamnose 3,5-epimerase
MKAKKYESPILIDPVIYEDHRGWFFESFHADKLKLGTHFIQDNHSYSEKKGTLRGLHLQLPPHEQAKLIRVIKGSVLDIIVDLRPKSSNYLSQYKFKLDDILKQSLYIPKGFAHGFLT